MGDWLRQATAVFVGTVLALVVFGLAGVTYVGAQLGELADTLDEPSIIEPTYDPDLEPEPESWPTETP